MTTDRSGPYIKCPSCGQKALSVATRCPHCGLAFETQLFRHPESGSKRSRTPLGLLLAAVVVLVLVVNGVRPKFSIAPTVAPPATTKVSAAPSRPQPLREPVAAKAESVRSPSPAHPPISDSARSVTPTSEGVAVGAVVAQRRYASTWMNLRTERSNRAPVIRILRPGEVVLVDLLEQGWYRVVTDRQALGYVDRRYLDTSPPP